MASMSPKLLCCGIIMGCLIMRGESCLWLFATDAGIPLRNNRSGQYPSMFLDNLLPLHFSSVALDGFIHGFYLIYYTTFVHRCHSLFYYFSLISGVMRRIFTPNLLSGIKVFKSSPSRLSLLP
jgi:hypothetical protein